MRDFGPRDGAPGPIPPACWGKDRWSAFAHVEGRCVDGCGRLEPQRMRTGVRPPRDPVARARLRGAAGHDDRDCLEDLIAVGLVTRSPRQAAPAAARYALAPLGWEVPGRLRAHRAGCGRLAEFRLDPGGEAAARPRPRAAGLVVPGRSRAGGVPGGGRDLPALPEPRPRRRRPGGGGGMSAVDARW